MPENASIPENAPVTASSPWRAVHPLVAFAAETAAIGVGEPGVRLEPVLPGRITLLIARRDASDAAQSTIAGATGIAPPAAGMVTRTAHALLVWTAPGQWLHVSEDEVDVCAALDPALVAQSDQTGARALVRISGPRAADALAKGLLVDLHPRAFRPDAVATTTTAHIGVTLWRDGYGFVLASGRSTAGDLWRFLVASAAEFGLAVGSA